MTNNSFEIVADFLEKEFNGGEKGNVADTNEIEKLAKLEDFKIKTKSKPYVARHNIKGYLNALVLIKFYSN